MEAAVRLSEHLLFLQRQQRQALGQAEAAVASLQVLSTCLQELSPDGLELKLQVSPVRDCHTLLHCADMLPADQICIIAG